MRAVLFIGAFVSVVYLVFWALFGSGTVSWNQRLTLMIETPQGEVRGSAVTEVSVTYHSNASLNFGTEVVYGLTGEAAVVEVLPGKYLFALIAGDEERFAGAAKERFVGLKRCEWLREIPRQTEAVTLTGDLIPTLVTFDDIMKPETVREVDPNDLAAAFGQGVQLQAVTLEITREAMTEGRVEGVLGWLADVWPNRLDGQRFGSADARNRFANSLSANSFSTEMTGK